VGAALGTIMAIIMIHHIRKTRNTYRGVQSGDAIIMFGISTAILVIVIADIGMPIPKMV
jgi:hypothetical protein